MAYSKEGIEQMAAEYEATSKKRDAIFVLFMRHAFQNEKAYEYATQGYMRRLNTLLRCLQNVFTMLPPESVDVPKRDVLTDATINLQAFLFNVFGCIDNLAWVWVHEHGWVHDKQINLPNDKEINRLAVGLGPKSKGVRNTLSDNLRKYLESLDGWFAGLGEYRDALAHRVPLYIPYALPESKAAEYQKLSEEKLRASQANDWTKYDKLDAAQNDLMEFRPQMTHSFAEAKGTLLFHAQLLADFNLVAELGNRIMAELPNRNDASKASAASAVENNT